MTALSLFEDDPAESAGFGDARAERTQRHDPRRDGAMDPAVLRPARPAFRNVATRGTTIPALALAVLLVSPGIWRYAQHELTFSVLLQRFVLIAVTTLVVLEVVRRYLDRAIVDPDADDVEADPDGELGGLGGLDGLDADAWEETARRAPAAPAATAPVSPASPATSAALDAGMDPALALLAGER